MHSANIVAGIKLVFMTSLKMTALSADTAVIVFCKFFRRIKSPLKAKNKAELVENNILEVKVMVFKKHKARKQSQDGSGISAEVLSSLDEKQNKNHNTKKVSLGPNTKR
ncbi:MAG: hypothetical protein GX488_03995 [Clostridiales bacterium]|nr:hypothetical protein [Clostridiales bacterium]